MAHLIRDFDAVLRFTGYLEHELEKRVFARLGLVKVEALQSLAPVYKNILKSTADTSKAQKVSALEDLLARLRNDVDSGIRAARNAQLGHSLKLPIERIPEQWLFMGQSTFTVLAGDVNEIDNAFHELDPTYPRLSSVTLSDHSALEFWRYPDVLGPPGGIRFAQIYAGPWTPDVISMLPGNADFQDASLRVFGLRLMLRQVGFLMLPFWQQGGPVSLWERLLLELSLIDFFSLEEAVYVGNVKGSTPSLIDEWCMVSPPHPGIALLRQRQSSLSAARYVWRDEIRNKVCAHMDPDVPGDRLDVANWPISLPDFHAEVEKLCRIIGEAARMDVRTRFMIAPAVYMQDVHGLRGTGAPRWADT